MNILLTGGSGDLGCWLAKDLEQRGDLAVRLDIRKPRNPQRGEFIRGSILDRDLLWDCMQQIDMVIHIAAWHGIHWVTGQRDAYDFWDLNVTGTFNVFQAAVESDIDRLVYISSTSALDRYGIYGHTKVLGEEIARTYHTRHVMQVLTLRPGAFIPYWNTATYSSYLDWAKWYWKGAVHIRDVAQAVLKSIDLLAEKNLGENPVLYVDGKYEYTPQDLENWDAEGPGSSFRKYYAQYEELAQKYGLDPTLEPEVFDIEPTRQWLGYEPTYSFMNLLEELAEYGEKGPPAPEF
jgi:nucleoside-diphosphate-sugar epimerase